MEGDRFFNSFPWLDRVSASSNYIPLYMDAHIKGKPYPMSAFSFETVFQMTFYEIVGPTNRDITRNEWKAGPLHSDQRQYWPGTSFAQFHRDGYPGESRLDGEKVVQQYKTAIRYLRESTISVSNQIWTHLSC
jgi:hypothetical protein